MSRALRIAVAAAALLAVAAPAQAAPAPQVRQLVVFRDGEAETDTVSTRALRVRVEGRRCRVGARTALAALVRSRPGRLRLRDFGSCSLDPLDGGGLFVSGIGADLNRGQNGWVYKVGRRAATAGAADPAGAFGNGRLRRGQQVTWFYCRLRAGGCQRTLELRLRAEPGTLIGRVRSYDDEGRGDPAASATVSAGGVSAATDANGVARLTLPPGSYRAVASGDGLIRSFAERATVP